MLIILCYDANPWKALQLFFFIYTFLTFMTSVCLNLGRFIKHNMCEIIDTNLRAETGDGQLGR